MPNNNAKKIAAIPPNRGTRIIPTHSDFLRFTMIRRQEFGLVLPITMDRIGAKRSRSPSPSGRRPEKAARMGDEWSGPRQHKPFGTFDDRSRRGLQNPVKEQARLNKLQEDERMREWVAQEDNFVLKQRKKKADIRVKEGRALPIDKLTVLLRAIDPTRDDIDDEVDVEDQDINEPDTVLEALSLTELTDLRRDIETYLHLETASSNREYWLVRRAHSIT